MESKQNHPSFEVSIDSFDAAAGVIALNGLSADRKLVEAFKSSLKRQDELLRVEEHVDEEGEVSLQARGLRAVSREHSWPAVAYFLIETAKEYGYEEVGVTINDPGRKTSSQATAYPISRD